MTPGNLTSQTKEDNVPDQFHYLDNAAATRLDERVLEAMKPYFFDTYAVATSQFGYSLGIDAKDALEAARATIAARAGRRAEEFIFTSGEHRVQQHGDQRRGAGPGRQEGPAPHHQPPSRTSRCSTAPARWSSQGFEVTYLRRGRGRPGGPGRSCARAITPETILVSIQAANQEIGTLQDMAAIGAICRERGVLFHTDATHTFPRVPLNVQRSCRSTW